MGLALPEQPEPSAAHRRPVTDPGLSGLAKLRWICIWASFVQPETRRWLGSQAGHLWMQVMPKTAQIVVEGVNLRVRVCFCNTY